MKEKLKQFGLSSLAVDNATSVFLITFMIFLFGIQSYMNIPKEQYPDASLPTVYINTPYFGNSAEEIENLVSRPLEKEIESIAELKKLNSTSIQDFSVIIAEMNADVEMSEAVRKVKDAVDVAKSELPTDLTQDPTILEVNFSDLPIMVVNVSGDYSPSELKEYAEYIQDKIEEIREVNEVNLKGAQDKEVQINLDLTKMTAQRVSFTDIENAIKSENMTMSGGEISSQGFKRSVRIIGQFEKVQQIKDLVVKSEFQRPVYLRDVADVKFTFEEKTSIARADKSPVISLDVIKRKGENLLAAADNVNTVVENAKKVLPRDLKITTFNDTSVNTRNQVSNLENSIISGVLLVVLVLLFFLGLRNASFVGMAIPLSMLMGIMILNITGTTLNVVVLFSLILALGLLVDNGIVVVENIYRYMQEGYSHKDASKYGAGEVALPIIASTATTLAAFIPLAFWPGMMGKFMKYMPITLMIVLASSLFVALVINPVLTSKFMKVEQDDKLFERRKVINVLIGVLIMVVIAVIAHLLWTNYAFTFVINDLKIKSSLIRNLMGIAALLVTINLFLLSPGAYLFQNKVLPVLETGYRNFISFALKGVMPYIIFFGTVLLLGFSAMLLKNNAPEIEFFPESDPQYVNAFIELPQGSGIAATNKVVKDVENKVFNILDGKMQAVEAVLTQIGENTSDPNRPPEPGVTPNKARITVQFVKSEDRGNISSKDIMNQMREDIKGNAGVNITIAQNASGPPAGKPINIELTGDNIDSLIVLSHKMQAFIENTGIQGIEQLEKDVNMGKPELLVHIDREAARRYGTSTYAISSAIRTSIYGKEISKFKQGEEDYPIMVRLSEDYRNNIDEIINQKVTFRNMLNGRIVQIPISAVADFKYSSTYTSIKRKDGERIVTIFSNVLDGYNSNEIVNELKTEMENFEMPEGYNYAFTGEQEQQAEDMAFLSGAFAIALFMIFFILVAQFNSITSPIIVLISIVLSLIGVLLGYYFTGDKFSVIFTGLGIISLAGIVVNNAIVLIDYINVLQNRIRDENGLDENAPLELEDVRYSIIKSGETRLRPVLLTAITTVLGLVPLAYGINFNFFTLISDLDPQYFQGGDNQAMWGPMAWTIIYGLTFATFLTLVVIPVMVWLVSQAGYFGKRLFVRK